MSSIMSAMACRKVKGAKYNPRTGVCETFKKGWLHVEITVGSQREQLELANIKDNLMKRGITFDTGMTVGTTPMIRDWELDWSLKGARPKTVLKHLDKVGIRYKTKPSPDPYPKRWKPAGTTWAKPLHYYEKQHKGG